MGIVLLILAGVIEISLAVYSFFQKSNQKRVRNWVRIGALLIFVVFATIMKWSFRWILVAAVLFIFGMIAFISLLRNKEEKKYRPVGTILKAVAIWGVVAVALVPAIIFRLMEKAVMANSELILPQQFISETAPDAYEVHIKGTNHLSLTDLPLVSPFFATMLDSSTDSGHPSAEKYKVIETMNQIVLEFFNSFVKNEGSFLVEEVY